MDTIGVVPVVLDSDGVVYVVKTVEGVLLEVGCCSLVQGAKITVMLPLLIILLLCVILSKFPV